jgi:thiamine biosynthesis lipoprotein
MGTTVRVVLYAPGREAADSAAAAAYRAVQRLDSLFSDYRDDSEIAELSRGAGGEARPVSDDLWRVLESAAAWAERTDGAFTVTVGPVTRLWRWALRRGELPDPSRLSRARERARPADLVLDADRHTARLITPGMSLDLGGIAKGYAADVMLDSLRAHGLPMAFVDAGGDLALGDAPPGTDGWRVEFPGGDVHHLARTGVATSGDRYQFLEVEGVRYSHIVDPRTGLGVADSPTVVVLAADATTADVLASALSVLDPAVGLRLVEALEGVEARRTAPSAVAPPERGPEVPASGDWQTEGFPGRSGGPDRDEHGST